MVATVCRYSKRLTLVVLALSASACAADEGALPQPSPTASMTVSPQPGTTPTGKAEEAVLAAYKGIYSAGRRAEHTPDGQRKSIIAPFATEPLLSRMLRGIVALRAGGRFTWGTPVFHPFDIKVKGQKATLHDCQDNRNSGQMDEKTSKRVLHGSENTHLVATLLLVEGAWKVSTLEHVRESCSVGS
ncbi:hypothetical protein [Microbispora hainanensis]|uniref:Nuclear transport factor 2 family protein n=1 Tax=Microbispora hainanensis TaxID=568844 RepID=A0ABZ1SMB0_9ACTN|nr:hypothetical protein [Microbispora hainanensis]